MLYNDTKKLTLLAVKSYHFDFK